MAIARLVPSILYNAAGTSYLSVTNESNAFDNTDSTDYATISNLTASTTNRYIYLRGFNFDDIPSGAVINSFRILLKAKQSGGSTSPSYCPVLCRGTATYNNSHCDVITTSVAVREFSFTQGFDTFRNDGDNFGIRINCRRGSRNTAASFNVYGAEIEVDYTLPSDDKYIWAKDTTWHRYTKAWKKVNGIWVQQSDLSTVFNSTTNYKKGN